MWVTKKPELGDQIRVSRGLYYHHGIYENDDTIYQFASPVGSEVSASTAEVCICNLETFLKGGVLEVRLYSDSELKEKRSPSEIIEYAKNHLGEKGYDLISNNCEHFASRCVFGKSESSQVDDVFSMLSKMFGGYDK